MSEESEVAVDAAAAADAGAGPTAPTASAAITPSPHKPRARTLPPPVSADEAQRRQRFYAELRRHRRAFGIVGGGRAPAEEEPPGSDDDAAADTVDSVADELLDPRAQQTALYLELLAGDLGPVEAGDAAFMRGFPRAFATWEAFDEALERYARGTFQPLRSHSAQATVARNKSTLKYLSTQLIPGTFIGHFYPERFEWYKKVLVCAICRAASARSKKIARSGGRGSAARTGPAKDTDAKVTAHLQPEAENSKRFVIDVSWSGAHSHRCDEDELAKFTHGAGRLDDPVLLSLVRKMRQDGKEPRDIKRFIYECTGKKCSTKEVHAMYQRMGTDAGGSGGVDEDSAPDDAALDFLNDDQGHQAVPTGGGGPRSGSPVPMEFDAVAASGGRLQLPPDRSIAAVLQNLKALANTLTSHEQAELANALQAVANSWAARPKRPSAGAMTPAPFPYALPLQPQPQQQHQPQPQLLPSPGGATPTFEYRRYDDVGADLLMGLDTPGSSGLGGLGRVGTLHGASMAAGDSRQTQKRRRS
ncbi:hypothetical protein PybrP1_008126 [[Pythium] brassicae (nom. inval.)]|nr:hypothetical protein PybrP1_008126 [[Pythium] brassicae (nom. inval.)]